MLAIFRTGGQVLQWPFHERWSYVAHFKKWEFWLASMKGQFNNLGVTYLLYIQASENKNSAISRVFTEGRVLTSAVHIIVL